MKNIKKIIGSALLATSFAVLSVGTTFALFTDDAKTTINVGSGKVDIGLTTDNLKLYSADSENTGSIAGTITDGPFAGTYYYKEMTNNFANGGSASLNGGNIAITNMTPGDRITFDVALADESNVNIKYRLVLNTVKTTGQADKMLAKGLEVTTDLITGTSAKYEKLEKYVSNWEAHNYNPLEPLSATYHFDIVLPLNAGNEYQNKGVEYSLSVQAVQGNAVTNNDDAGTFYFLTDVEPVVANTDTTLEAKNSNSSIIVNTVIPKEEGLTPGSNVELVVSDLDVQSATEEIIMNFDVTLYVDGVEKSTFTQSIEVNIYVGKNLDIKHVYHKNVELIKDTDFTYNPSTGYITFVTTTFSPFTVIYEVLPYVPDTSLGFYDSVLVPVHGNPGDDDYVPAHYEHHIDSITTFRKLPKFLNDYLKTALTNDDEIRYADENTIYFLDQNIDFNGGAIWDNSTDIGYIEGVIFEGTLTGKSNKTLLSNITIDSLASQKPVLFKQIGNSTFKNLELSNITVHGVKKVGLLAVCQSSDVASIDESTLVLENVLVHENVTITASDNSLGTLIGDARNFEHIIIESVTTSATLSGVQSVGGIIGSITEGHKPEGQSDYSTRTLTINNSYVYGSITGKSPNNGIAGFIGYAGTSSDKGKMDLSMTNCEFGGVLISNQNNCFASSIAVWSGTDTIGSNISLTNVRCSGIIKSRGELNITGKCFLDLSPVENRFSTPLVKDANGNSVATYDAFKALYYQPNSVSGNYYSLSVLGTENGISGDRANKEVKKLTVTIPEEALEEASYITVVASYARHTASYTYDAVAPGASGWGIMYNETYSNISSNGTVLIPRVLYTGHTMAKNKTSYPSSDIAEYTNWDYGRFNTTSEVISSLNLQDGLNFIGDDALFLIDNRNVDTDYYLLPNIASALSYNVTLYNSSNVEIGAVRVSDMWLGSRGILTYSISEYVL